MTHAPVDNSQNASVISIHISTNPGADPTDPNELPTSPGTVEDTLTNSQGRPAAGDATEPANMTIPNSRVIVEELPDDDPDHSSAPDLSPTVEEIEVMRPAADQYTLQVKVSSAVCMTLRSML